MHEQHLDNATKERHLHGGVTPLTPLGTGLGIRGNHMEGDDAQHGLVEIGQKKKKTMNRTNIKNYNFLSSI